jgi:hypothetical protein
MKKSFYIILFFIFYFNLSYASSKRGVRESESKYYYNPILAYSHLQPTPYTLKAGTLVLGTQISFGLTSFLQIGTDIFRDFYKIYNANLKINFLKFEDYAMAFILGYEKYNLKDVNAQNPDIGIQTIQPGITNAIAFSKELGFTFSGSISNTKVNSNSPIYESGVLRGTRIGADLSWAYNPQPRTLGNVLSFGTSYDLTYKMFGYGLSHHFPGFQFGVHYFPKATSNKYFPIIAGGLVFEL